MFIYHHLFEHVLTFKLVYKSLLVTCHMSGGLDILSSYFISFIVWISDIGQVSVNITLITALIINFTFLIYFYSLFL